MSHQAICWALSQPVKPTSAKHVLTVLAHYVSATRGGPWVAYPSVSQLAQDTGQDRKTIITNIKRLLDQGYIVDTGEREGATKSVPVYMIMGPESSTQNGTPSVGQSSTNIPTASMAEAVPNEGHLSSAEIGTPSGLEAVPIHPRSSTNSSVKQYQSTPEAVPICPREQVEQVLGTGRSSIARAPAYTRTREDGTPPLPHFENIPDIPDAAPNRKTQISVLLRRNGADPRTYPGSKGIAELAAIDATDVQILTALETAKQRRADAEDPRPANAAYLVPIVRELQIGTSDRPRGKYAKDFEEMAALNTWADAELRKSQDIRQEKNEIDMGVIDATSND